jgi:hypothetical protein
VKQPKASPTRSGRIGKRYQEEGSCFVSMESVNAVNNIVNRIELIGHMGAIPELS